MGRHGTELDDRGPRIPVAQSQWRRVVRFVETFQAIGGGRFTFDGINAQLVMPVGMPSGSVGRWRPGIIVGATPEERLVQIGEGALWVNGTPYTLDATGEDALEATASGYVYVRYKFPVVTDDSTTTTTTTTTTPDGFDNPDIMFSATLPPAPDEREITWPIAYVTVASGVPVSVVWLQLSDLYLIGEQVPVVTGGGIDTSGPEPKLVLNRRRIWAIPSEVPPPDDVEIGGVECTTTTTTTGA